METGERAFDRIKKSLEEVRDFYAGKPGKIKFHVPDGEGGFITREMDLNEFLALNDERA